MSDEYELEQHDAIIDAVMQSRVSQLFVEFLQQGGPKPHVVLRLNIRDTKVRRTVWMGCRFAMDLAGGYNGVFHITPLAYNDSSHAAHAAFEFKLRVDWRVHSFIDAFRNLVDFSFVGGFMQAGSNIEYIDGCRDFVSQAFILLHKWKAVSWRVRSVTRGTFNGENLTVREGETGFHEIIGYNYKINPRGGNYPTIVESLSLARGTFAAQDFRRVIIYDQFRLPYHPDTPQVGDEGYQPSLYSTPVPTYPIPSQGSSSTQYTQQSALQYTQQPVAIPSQGSSSTPYTQQSTSTYSTSPEEYKSIPVPEPASKDVVYWTPSEGISWTVISTSLTTYLPGARVEKDRRNHRDGYRITAIKEVDSAELTAMLSDLKVDTAAWRKEGGDYNSSNVFQSRSYWGGSYATGKRN